VFVQDRVLHAVGSNADESITITISATEVTIGSYPPSGAQHLPRGGIDAVVIEGRGGG
jgi:hypothetical protein